ncbi:putative acetyltransferase [Mycolicibacterium sp. 624]
MRAPVAPGKGNPLVDWITVGEVDSDLIVRPYRPADEDAVVSVWARAAREAHPFVVGEGEGEREQKMRDVYLVEAENWVVESVVNGTIVGLLGMLGSEIGGLFVAPEAQRRGVGRALVEHASALHGTVTLEVYQRNQRARRFYARMGFEEIGHRPEEETGHELIALRRGAVAS